MRQSPRVIFQPPNGIGLGHISRTLAMAIELRKKETGSKIIFALAGGGGKLVDVFDFPSFTLPKPSPRWKSWTRVEFQGFMRDFCYSLVANTRPDLVVFDLSPEPCMFQAALENDVRMALCIRESKDMKTYYLSQRDILPHMRLLIFPHEEGELYVPDEYREKSRFVGEIARVSDVTEQGFTRRGGARFIVISGGGGGYPGTVDFYNLALKALAACNRPGHEVSGLLVTGPLFKEWERLEPNSDVRIIPFAPNLQAIFLAADVVVCQGGYNTLTEIKWLGVPTVCVPAPRQADDQYKRAEEISASHPHVLVVRKRDPEPLAAAVNSALGLPRHPTETRRPPAGASLATEALLGLLNV